MREPKLYLVMVGLPARGKSTIAAKLKEYMTKDGIRTRIFNNGDLRRRLIHQDTSDSQFYDPRNLEASELREKIAETNMRWARKYLSGSGQVAILDATNGRVERRQKISTLLNDHALLFIECLNTNMEILEASISRKIGLPEFDHLAPEQAAESFKQRIRYYETRYRPLGDERNFIKLDSLSNIIEQEEILDNIPFYDRIRDFLVTDHVKNLFLVRHGETFFNLENRIGGDSPLTENGKAQARKLADRFKDREIPIIFTSQKARTIQTAEPIRDIQQNCVIFPLNEFNEIDAGVCECMSYEEIEQKMPQVFLARKQDKYGYVYPQGEGYVSMKARINQGIKKALFLSSNSSSLMIIGHRAVNRMILSHFLYRRDEDVPYIYIPQDRYYHIVSTHNKKLFQLIRI